MNDLHQRIADLSPQKRAFLEKYFQKKQQGLKEPILPRSKNEANEYPLSFAQRRLWFLDQLLPGNPAYNITIAVCLTGSLDMSALEQSFRAIIQRHEILRTAFDMQDGHPVQRISLGSSLPLVKKDLRQLADSEQDAEVSRIIAEDTRLTIDLTQEPLFRITVLRLHEEKHVVVLTLHHIVFDGWSSGVLVREIATLYNAFSQKKPSPLPNMPIQYADFAVWQQQRLQGAILEEQLGYWKKQLDGRPARLDLPTDHPRPALQNFYGARQPFSFPKLLSQKIKALSDQEKTTVFMTLLAALNILFHRYTGQDDIIVGSTTANRNRPETEGLIGFFVNTLVLRTYLHGNPTFRELLERVRKMTLDAYEYQDLPFEKLVEELQPERDLSQTPLVQVMFDFDNTPLPVLELPGLTIHFLELKREIVHFDLTLTMEDTGAELRGRWEYNTDIFENATIVRMAEHFQTLLENITANPEQRLSELLLLKETERHQLLVKWNATAMDYPQEDCITDLFEAQVEETPDIVAVALGDRLLTYRELNSRANQLASHLRKLGVGPEVFVGICTERSQEMVVSILGVLKAGGAYMPLDPASPHERLRFMLQDAGVSVLLTQQRLTEKFPECDIPMVFVDTDWETIAAEPAANLNRVAMPENAAYAIYTSGSTGKPKGAVISHQALVNYALAIARQFELRINDRVLQFASIGFDVMVEELFPSWISGATVVLLQNGVPSPGEDFLKLIEEERLTVFELPTAYWHAWVHELSRLGKQPPTLLRLVIIGGEKVLQERVQVWQKSGVPLLHVYGLTETTVTSTLYKLPVIMQDRILPLELPIGRPIANTQIYILDSCLQPVSVGVTGELYIGGVGVARGYLNRPQLTAEKFIPDPFCPEPGARLYKTGDLARYLPDGNIEFSGRADYQVKIRGYRFELGEIEAVLTQHPIVRETVVVVREDNPGNKRLIAYVVPEPGSTFSSSELRQFLQEKLPDYMTPALFVMIDSFPLSPNGKVDRRALPVPAGDRPDLVETYVAPRNSVEERLVQVWEEVLDIEPIGIQDNFFEIGGDSIISIQIVARANQAGIRISPMQIFQHPTIAQLAATGETAPIVRADQGVVTGAVKFTPIQHWFFNHHSPVLHHWNMGVLLEARQTLNPVLLEKAIHQLLIHHDALRLYFVQTETGWRQFNAPIMETAPFDVKDLSMLSQEEQDRAIETIATALQKSLNLSEPPLLRSVLFNLGSQRPAHLLVIAHHLVIDGVSLRILLEDLLAVYRQLGQDEPLQLPPKSTSFQYWSQRLEEYSCSTEIQEELPYWEAIAYQQIWQLPLDYPEGLEHNTVASTHTITMKLDVDETLALLQEVPKAYGTQVNEVLLTALVQAFDTPSLFIELESHGREGLFEEVDLSRTVGWFTSTFPVLLTLEQGPDATDQGTALKTIKELLRQIPRGGIGYGLLRYLSHNTRNIKKLKALPHPEVSFNYLGQFDQVLSSSFFKNSRIPIGSAQDPQEIRPYIIEIEGSVFERTLRIFWTYSKNLHDRMTVEQWAQNFMAKLRALIAHCQSPEAGDWTPSDFPMARLSQDELDAFMAKISSMEDVNE